MLGPLALCSADSREPGGLNIVYHTLSQGPRRHFGNASGKAHIPNTHIFAIDPDSVLRVVC